MLIWVPPTRPPGPEAKSGTPGEYILLAHLAKSMSQKQCHSLPLLWTQCKVSLPIENSVWGSSRTQEYEIWKRPRSRLLIFLSSDRCSRKYRPEQPERSTRFVEIQFLPLYTEMVLHITITTASHELGSLQRSTLILVSAHRSTRRFRPGR